MNPFRILWKSLADVYDNLFVAIGMNVLWLLLSIPAMVVIAGGFILFGLPSAQAFVLAPFLATLFPGPGSIGIHYYMNQLYKEDRVEFSMYWTALRQFWWRASLLFLLGLVVDLLLFVNMRFYLENEGVIKFLAILWFYAFLLWSMMLLYMNPLLIEQSDKSFRLIVRNAFLLCIDNPIPSVVIFLMLAIISILSIGIALFIALVTGSYVAATETRAVLSFLEKIRARAATSPR
jgi:uncharacterized membrane protein YesL